MFSINGIYINTTSTNFIDFRFICFQCKIKTNVLFSMAFEVLLDVFQFLQYLIRTNHVLKLISMRQVQINVTTKINISILCTVEKT